MPDTNQSGSIKKADELPGFAPDDPTDGREPLDWKSKYPEDARKLIWREASYLFGLLLLLPLLMLVFWLGYPQRGLKLSDQQYEPVLKYALAWLGGMLGGTLFDIKWLYHVVARQVWHLDRQLWRLFTPHISGGLAFAIVALISSGMLRVFDSQAAHSRSLIIAVAFLVGYFSDSAIAKLSEIAETVFGASRAKEKHKRKRSASDQTAATADELPSSNDETNSSSTGA